MKKIAIVNQRYGLEVNGGSEQYTRMLAEHLKKYYEVEILTTTAQDYSTWTNAYPVGEEMIQGIRVKRFPVEKKRWDFRFRVVNKLVQVLGKRGIDFSEWWLKEQGPYTPELIAYIASHPQKYEAILFVTYLYYPTAAGLKEAEGRAILIPTAHNEPYLYYPIYQEVFHRPRWILFLTEEERGLVHEVFQNSRIPHDVIGSGIDIPADIQPEKFQEKYHIKNRYLLYAGRVDVGKNCEEMFRFFEKYKRENKDDDIELVVIGKGIMEIPKRSYIHALGYVSEEDKNNAMAGAEALWLPSKYESLSLSLLEAMALGTLGIVNGECNVLKGHCEKSGVGIAYCGYTDFAKGMKSLYQSQSSYYEKAVSYVSQNYTWDIVEKKVVHAIENISQ